MSQPWIVIMPEEWEPRWCWESYRHANHTCSKCLEIYKGTGNSCPLANAKKAVEVGPHHEINYRPGIGWRNEGKTVTLYAVEQEDKK